jgi:hypothetical protein
MHRAALAAAAAIEDLLTPFTEGLARHYAERWSPELAFRCDRASHLQFNRYEPRRQSRELLTDAHEDGLYLTLLFADAPGLEVRTPAGSPWIANASNAGVDIIERSITNPTRYGLPPLPRDPAPQPAA